MRILVLKNVYVDFEAPIFMFKDQKEMFVKGMKKIFGDIQIKHVKEQITEMPEREIKTVVDWKNPKNLLLLTTGLTNEQIADILGIGRKHIFAIQLKRASFILPLHKWARKKGISQITEKDIQEYLQEGK